jgi:peptidoglycan/xylan/chitin deacetylase (PgdA/CDA1 family)
MYHGISSKKNFSINGRHLPAEEFEKHLQYFKANFDILSLAEICRVDNKGKRPCIAITFDDGYLNNFQQAVPLLLKYQTPATFFISTVSLTDHQYIHPPDYIDMLNQSVDTALDINGRSFSRSNNRLVHDHTNAYDYINSLSFDDFTRTLETLHKEYPLKDVARLVDPEVFKLVSSEVISSFQSVELFTIGSHSHHHVNLTKLSREEVNHQLQTSKSLLERDMAISIDALAFPYGYFNENVVDAAIQAGYQYQIAGGNITNEWRGKVFPRIGVLNMAGFAYNMLSINRGFRNFGF